jgi:hypothetical protein
MGKYALLIGVSEYQAEGLKPLPAAVKDVVALKEVLQRPDVGGFDEANITVLSNPDRQQMETTIDQVFHQVGKDDLLLFYFSGHGLIDPGNGDFYFSTRDTRKRGNRPISTTAVSPSFIHRMMGMGECQSRRQVVILDCCYAGSFVKGLQSKDDGTVKVAVQVAMQLGSEGRVVLTASTSIQYAYEKPDFALSIYTHYLVEGLAKGTADLNDDGVIDVYELHEYVREKVQEANPNMTPEFYGAREGHTIVIAASPNPALKYRKEVEKLVEEGKFDMERDCFPPVTQSLLNEKREKLHLSVDDGKAIVAEILQPIQEYERKKKKYRQTLIDTRDAEDYPFCDATQNALKEYQVILGLRDEDVEAIVHEVLKPIREYKIKKNQYRQELINILRNEEYPFCDSTQNRLKKYQTEMRLQDEDVEAIEIEILPQAKTNPKKQETFAEVEALSNSFKDDPLDDFLGLQNEDVESIARDVLIPPLAVPQATAEEARRAEEEMRRSQEVQRAQEAKRAEASQLRQAELVQIAEDISWAEREGKSAITPSTTSKSQQLRPDSRPKISSSPSQKSPTSRILKERSPFVGLLIDGRHFEIWGALLVFITLYAVAGFCLHLSSAPSDVWKYAVVTIVSVAMAATGSRTLALFGIIALSYTLLLANGGVSEWMDNINWIRRLPRLLWLNAWVGWGGLIVLVVATIWAYTREVKSSAVAAASTVFVGGTLFVAVCCYNGELARISWYYAAPGALGAALVGAIAGGVEMVAIVAVDKLLRSFNELQTFLLLLGTSALGIGVGWLFRFLFPSATWIFHELAK